MDGFIVNQSRDGGRTMWYHVATGVEYVIEGGEPRRQLAELIVAHLESLSDHGIRLLRSFMKDCGEFDLSSVEVLPTKSEDGTDFCLRYHFTADHDPHEYDYTYFEVYFSHDDPPGRPFSISKFTVGFQ
ncbi:MAG: hypothetical protein U0800_27825 [Isosphaeraceae bacterium]